MGPTREQLVAAAIDTLTTIAMQRDPINASVYLLARVIFRNAIEHGVECEFGRNGDELCIPSRWDAEGWAWQTENCRHCPVYIQYFTEQTH